MKILYITNNLNGMDGWSRYSLDIIKEIKKTKHNILCLVNEFSYKKNNYEIRTLDTPLKYLVNPYKSYKNVKNIKEIIKKFNPDVIHFIVEPYITILPFLKIKKNVKIIITIHGTYSYFPNTIKNKFKKLISLYLFKISIFKVNKIISVSKFTKNYLLENIKNNKFKNFIEKKIVVATNGINLDDISFTEKNSGKKNIKKNILFVGAIKPRKGILESVKVLKYYKNNFSDNFVYNIIGSYNKHDDYYKKIINKIKEYNLENRIFFRGSLNDREREKYYEEADLFLMLPINDGRRFEGFGIVYLEANARGVACVGSNDSGAREAILDGKTGYVVNHSNPILVAEKINQILNKKKIKKENCINWAKNNNIKIKINKLLEYYNK